MARHGTAWRGKAWRGTAWRGVARRGMGRQTIKLVLLEGMDKRRLDELHGQVQDLILSEVPKE